MAWTAEDATKFCLAHLLRRKDPQLVAFPNEDSLEGVVPTLGTITKIAGAAGWYVRHMGYGVFVAYDAGVEVLTFFAGGSMLHDDQDRSYTPIQVVGSRHRRLRVQRKVMALVPALGHALAEARAAATASAGLRGALKRHTEKV